MDKFIVDIFFANSSSSIEYAKLLIEFSANINEKDDDGCTNLTLVLDDVYSLISIEYVKLLIELGTDVNAKK